MKSPKIIHLSDKWFLGETQKKENKINFSKGIIVMMVLVLTILLSSCIFPGPGGGNRGGNHEHHENHEHHDNDGHRH